MYCHITDRMPYFTVLSLKMQFQTNTIYFCDIFKHPLSVIPLPLLLNPIPTKLCNWNCTVWKLKLYSLKIETVQFENWKYSLKQNLCIENTEVHSLEYFPIQTRANDLLDFKAIFSFWYTFATTLLLFQELFLFS